MKILKLRLNNLNSLYGEWSIDFTDPAFQDSGLFAITGPTGGGKSTVLDAICLALYGETPRLKSINASANEIMSRHTGESYSELEYEINGKLYLSRWFQRRARSKADGALQSVKREISVWSEESGKYEGIASKIKEVENAVERVTGMDFERFTRSIMLAQGNFAAFLQANDDERASLLEQITGTDIYTKISQEVHERHKVETQKLQEIEARMGSVDLLSGEELEKLATEQSELAGEVTKLAKLGKSATEKIHWIQGLAALEKKGSENEVLLKELEQKEKQFAAKGLVLDAAKRAVKVDLFYAPVSSARQSVVSLTAKQKSVSGQIVEGQEGVAQGIKSLEVAQKNQSAVEVELEKQKPIWRQVRMLDTKLEGATSQLEIARKNVSSSKGLLDKEQQQLLVLTAKQRKLADELKSTKEYLERNTQDKVASENNGVIQNNIAQWMQQNEQVGGASKKIATNQERLTKGSGVVASQIKAVELAEQEQSQAEKLVGQLKESLSSLLDGRQLREFEVDLRHLYEKKEYEVKIQSLESHRAQLVDGEPCPLCGAEDHPYSDDGAVVDKTAVIVIQIGELELKIKQISKTEKDYIQSNNQLAILTKNHQQLVSKLNDYNERIAELEVEQKVLNEESKGLKESLKTTEQGLSVDLDKIISGVEFTPEALEKVSWDIQKKAETWKAATDKAEPLQQEIQQIAGQEAILKTKVESLVESYKKAEAELVKSNTLRLELLDERKEVFQDRVVDTEEVAWNSKLKEAAQFLANTQTQQHEKEKVLGQLKQSLIELEKQFKEMQAKLVKDEASLLKAISDNQFVGESAYLGARLSVEELNQLEQLGQALRSERERLSALSVSLKKDLLEQREKKLTDVAEEDLVKELEGVEKSLNEKNQLVGTIREKLATHEKNVNRQAEDAEKKRAQIDALRVWKHLHSLIGSSDGKKFRNYAQGLTFEWVVSFANTQLESITDRYILTRDKVEPLQLNVLDNYQGGEERSTKNLSGGESFLISLALALGLSQMVSDNIQMDSLFLDEGFGTLDEDTLELAMDALSSLRQEGKLIGVISHVQELKERLTTQIVVKPQSGGKSELSGAGVARS